MLNSDLFSKKRLDDLECQLLDKELELKEAITSKGKYLKCLNFENKINHSIGITGLSQGLLNSWDDLEPFQRKEYALAIAKSSDRIANLLNNLLDLANIYRNDFNLNLEPWKFYRIFKDQSRRNKDIKFSVDFNNDLTLICDKYLIHQLFDNLISRITSFTEINCVEARVKKVINAHDLCIEITFSYQSAAVTDKSFNEFWHKKALQQSNSTGDTEFDKDTCLSLACKIVELHEGEISLKQSADSLILALPI